MRIIAPKPSVHNEAARPGVRFAPALLALLLVSLAGCGGGGESETAGSGAGNRTEAAAPDAPLVVDDAGWRAVAAVAERFGTGEAVPLVELADVAHGESFSTWSECLDDNRPDAARIARWLEAAYGPDAGVETARKTNVDRAAMVASYRYSRDKSAVINEKLAAWHTTAGQDEFLRLARRWIDADRLPDPLTLHFLPTPPELRYCPGRLIADTGVVAASRPEQLRRNLVSLLYRNLQIVPDFEGPEYTPEQSMLAVFRLLLNEGVGAWIDNAPYTWFSQDHYSLYKISLVPEHFYRNGVKTVGVLNSHLPRMLDDEAYRDERIPTWSYDAAAGGTLTQAGYAMCAAIAHHLGEDRLVEVRHSVPAFVAAYQEAALMNPSPQPRPGEPGAELAESMPPLDPELYERLQGMLASVYAE